MGEYGHILKDFEKWAKKMGLNSGLRDHYVFIILKVTWSHSDTMQVVSCRIKFKFHSSFKFNYSLLNLYSDNISFLYGSCSFSTLVIFVLCFLRNTGLPNLEKIALLQAHEDMPYFENVVIYGGTHLWEAGLRRS
jgi:hypothetical protein